ncbi:hypothetical protein NM2008223_2162 [Neisseria meningitidis 2008223]|nr:hypothetical protein NM2008223_2162 [Neisseria meningitidis 2008223]EPF53240.1 hypothetical protein NM98002_2180 [Neisseria meningitidis 98002]
MPSETFRRHFLSGKRKAELFSLRPCFTGKIFGRQQRLGLKRPVYAYCRVVPY